MPDSQELLAEAKETNRLLRVSVVLTFADSGGNWPHPEINKAPSNQNSW